ncbi:hypothetical protein FNB79_01715 [Formosa sediminum]|uniref:Uncharacterized protein n=1 Tax=Formosa sediminum TaxID=2594004 RepID=A0A516GMK8_9FLAO|nr:hypothetical protein [Formosa sediminum]QDO92743.1 hypothetical protein FNB79_01715 [Formosa sediminum]
MRYTCKGQFVSPFLDVIFETPNVVEVETRYSSQFRNWTYSINSFDDTQFTIHNLRINTATYFPKNIERSNNVNNNSNISDGFQKVMVFEWYDIVFYLKRYWIHYVKDLRCFKSKH